MPGVRIALLSGGIGMAMQPRHGHEPGFVLTREITVFHPASVDYGNSIMRKFSEHQLLPGFDLAFGCASCYKIARFRIKH